MREKREAGPPLSPLPPITPVLQRTVFQSRFLSRCIVFKGKSGKYPGKVARSKERTEAKM